MLPRHLTVFKVLLVGIFLLVSQALLFKLVKYIQIRNSEALQRTHTEAEPLNRAQRQLNRPDYKCVRKKDLFGKFPAASLEFWLHQLEMSAPNIPFRLLYEKRNEKSQLFPCIFDLKVANEGVWQRFEISSLKYIANLWLYSAYLDNRARVKAPTIRIYAAGSEPNLGKGIFCHIWFTNSSQPITVPVHSWNYLGFADSVAPQSDDGLTPHSMQLNCRLPQNHISEVPNMISLINSPSDRASNALKVNYFQPAEGSTRKTIGVCVKNLQYPTYDISSKLVVWFEMLRELGVDKIFVYYMDIHPNITRVLEHYVESGFLESYYTPLPGNQPSSGIYQHIQILHRANSHIRLEKIVQNDCFMRNIYQFRYLAIIDIDEVIVPRAADSYVDLINSLEEKKVVGKSTPAIMFQHAYYFGVFKEQELVHDDDFVFKYSIRSAIPIKAQMKSFLSTQWALTLSTHKPTRCLPPWGSKQDSVRCNLNSMVKVFPKVALLAHFRPTCSNDLPVKTCHEQRSKVTRDTRLLKYKESVLSRVRKVRELLHLT